MEPDINQKRAFVQQEFQRRAAGQEGSTAGINPSSDALAARAGMPSPTTPDAGAVPSGMDGGASGAPSDGTIAGMKQQKGESEKLTDALIYRMKKLTEQGK